jgi:DNA-binding HxlR family transcriptional regulator
MSNQSIKSPERRKVRPDAFVAVCPSRPILSRLGEKWSLLVIAALADHPLHFGELRRKLEGVSQKMLAQTLRALERDGLVKRRLIDARRIRVEYSLTPLGSDFSGHAMQLKSWVEANLRPIHQRQNAYDRREAAAT